MVQHLWFSLRQKSLTLHAIDKLFALQNEPIQLVSSTLWSSAVVLALLLVMELSMAVVAILPPGSLTVVKSNYSFPQEYQVPTINWGTPPDFPGFQFNPISKLAVVVLVDGAYIAPTSPCGECEYTLTFDTPVFQCTNTTNPSTPPFHFPSTHTAWNSTSTWDTSRFHLSIEWLHVTLNGYANFLSVGCSAFNATYIVQAQHSITSDTLHLLNLTYHSQFIGSNTTSDEQALKFRSIIDRAAGMLDRSISLVAESVFGAPDIVVGVESTLAIWSKLVTFPAEGFKAVDLISAVPMFMQNVSLSLLAVKFADWGGTDSLTNTPTTCYISANIFQYEPALLLGTYRAAMLVTGLCILVGLHTMFANHEDSETSFSRLVEVTRNGDLDELVGQSDWQIRRKLRFGSAAGFSRREVFSIESA
jgi:hypothetical protein